MAKLTEKQENQYRTFAQEYIINFNGTEAAIKAGYSEKTASSQASRLLTHAKVQEFIQEYIKGREKRTEITGDMVIQELAKIAFVDVKNIYDDNGDLLPIPNLPSEITSAISTFKTRKENQGNSDYDIIEEYKMHDKMRALEMLGKHTGIFEKDNNQKKTENTTEWKIEFVKPDETSKD